ncbi:MULTISPECIES: DUF3293 domain-containing protein [unclassified Caballeronia]|uniref:DUF3293 domain-containing protein n=1 Tax=unclassified Caballeronia TaxID=2646786 RepID=UPI0028607476|nr:MULTISPECIES: DUF3293 domain-containing protein [unclassified Caballeronia]MDR5739749.1 DUF3293 domain-containing protein [Caballeronia sp. LZ016]MDR5808214.1 DUF3293 domain-containing protein [Caballeronia sp. LZ019]
MNAIPDKTLDAYRLAIYRVEGEPPIDMIVGKKNDAIAPLLTRHGVASAVFVTAFNPFGRELSQDENTALQKALIAQVQQSGRTALPGAGLDPDGAWTAEASLLVLGADDHTADELMTAFKQNAVVIVQQDGVPRLRLHPRYR